MSDESKVSKADILEQMQAGHRARIDGSMLENWNKDAVQFQQVVAEGASAGETVQQPECETSQPDSYRSYASKLLEEMRGVYASSWEDCSCGSSPAWKGGHNHFYDPCSGADNPPPSSCPVYDCDNTCCNDHHPQHPHHPKPPRPPKPPYYPEPDCGCGTTTCYDDDSYYLKKMSDQLNRIEALTKEIYAVSQQIAGYGTSTYCK